MYSAHLPVCHFIAIQITRVPTESTKCLYAGLGDSHDFKTPYSLWLLEHISAIGRGLLHTSDSNSYSPFSFLSLFQSEYGLFGYRVCFWKKIRAVTPHNTTAAPAAPVSFLSFLQDINTLMWTGANFSTRCESEAMHGIIKFSQQSCKRATSCLYTRKNRAKFHGVRRHPCYLVNLSWKLLRED